MSRFISNLVGFAGYSGAIAESAIAQLLELDAGESADKGPTIYEANRARVIQPRPDGRGDAVFGRHDLSGIPSEVAGPAYYALSVGDAAWWEFVHVTPMRADIGQIVDDVSVPFTLYNATRGASVDLTSIDLSGVGGGVSVSPAPSLPLTIEEQTRYQAALIVSATGDPTLDGQIVFNTDANNPAIYLTGFRIVVFDWEFVGAYSERLEFLTDIIGPKLDRSEQRSASRAYPRRVFEVQASIPEGPELTRFNLTMLAWQGRNFAVPLRAEGVELQYGEELGAQSLRVTSTANLGFEVGGFVLMETPGLESFAAVIESVTDEEIQIGSPLPRDFLPMTAVYPCKVAEIIGDVQRDRFPVALADVSLEFRLISGEVPDGYADASGFPVYKGLPVIDSPNVVQGQLGESTTLRVVVVDGGTGVTGKSRVWPGGLTGSAFTFSKHNQAGMVEVKRALYALNGRVEAFWVPTGYLDLALTEDAASTATQIVITNVGYARFASDQQTKRDIRITLTNGTVVYHEVTAAVQVDDQFERLTLSPALSVDLTPATVRRIDFLEKFRFGADTQVIRHRPTGGCVVTIPTREVIA